MKMCKTIDETRDAIADLRKVGKTLGFVPTMGALHEGHAALIRAARKQSDLVAVSIFVNPAQFGPKEDFAKYPRPFDADCRLCEREGADLVFTATPEEMYPRGYDTYVVQEHLAGVLCGKSRPNHFRGVLTVVLKLFNIVAPDFAFFGQKDAQQVIIIKRMASDLNLPVRLVTIPTTRESDGLAMSSRNAYLSPDERRDAACLHEALSRARDMVRSGEKNAGKIREGMTRIIRSRQSARIDYVGIVDAHGLNRVERIENDVLVALAVYIGATRLIDNLCLTHEGQEILC
jgi:pantoate--beta-alanine ligase